MRANMQFTSTGSSTTGYDSKMHVKDIGVYWKFKNVLKSVNDSINTITGGVNIDPITFREGYWSFTMISERLGESNIQLERNRHDNTCKIRSAKQLNLLNFGPLLGFPANNGRTTKHVDELAFQRRREPGVAIRNHRVQLRRHRQKL